MKRIAIINGPNLNLLGIREPEMYGTTSFESFFEALRIANPSVHLSYFQSNVEGALIDYMQSIMHDIDGIICNPGGYSHTSVALADCMKAVHAPIVEVHISNIYKRESYRHVSLTAASAVGVISGLGLTGYQLALDYLNATGSGIT